LLGIKVLLVINVGYAAAADVVCGGWKQKIHWDARWKWWGGMIRLYMKDCEYLLPFHWPFSMFRFSFLQHAREENLRRLLVYKFFYRLDVLGYLSRVTQPTVQKQWPQWLVS